MRRVVIIQRRLTHYRLPLFTTLRERLAARGIELDLLAGTGTRREEQKRDAGKLDWAEPVPTRYFLNGRLCWQSLGGRLAGADLVIVTQENKLLQNHRLLLAPRRFRLAFWGHGANLQSDNPHGFKERYKRWTTNKVDWWFAYTPLSAMLVQAAGFDGDRVTVLNNAVDTAELQQHSLSITAEERQALRALLRLGPGPVGIYVGSLYEDKRLDFLFAAAEAIRQVVPGFQLLVVGEGPEQDRVRAWCDLNSWTRWVGARFGREKVAHVALADIMLAPAAVGLGVLDAFACGVPLVTADAANHGPEIAYLRNGVNGVMTANRLEAYVDACVHLLGDERARSALRAGCVASAGEYTIDNMAQRFADGVGRCLDMPRYSRLAS